MPRPKTILQSEFPYSITGRCINREWFELSMDQVWLIMCHQLYYIHHVYDVKIHSFVLMNNHFHLIASTPQSNISEAMANFMKETSRLITKASHRINQTYGGRYFRCIIESHQYYLHAYKYVYRNPVQVGITNLVQDYKYSSLNGLLGQEPLLIPIEYDDTLFSNIEDTLKWLNEEPDQDNWNTIGKALKKSKFKLAKDKHSKKDSYLEFNML